MSISQAKEDEEKYKLHPMYLFHKEIKDKSLKKSALESITTFSIALGRRKTREQLIPFLGQLFIEENVEMKKIILKGLTKLLHPVYIGKSHHSCLILELVMDILCVFAEPQIRIEAYQCLSKVFAFMDVRKAQNILVSALKKLNDEGNGDRNIRDLMVRMIPYVYAGVDGDNEVELLQILNTFKQNLQDQKLLSQVLTEFIKVMPPTPETQIKSIIQLLLQTKDRTILANLIVPVTLLAQVSGEEATVDYIKAIISSEDSYVISFAFKKFRQLSQVFSQVNLTQLIEKIGEFDSQPQQVKNSILEMLEYLPVCFQDRQKLCQPPSSLQLKNTLSDTLCRLQYKDALVKLFNSVDPNFQLKMFPKLPPTCELHIDMLDKIMNGKSWRQKLLILENIANRTKNGENTQILVLKLCSFIGDKIAAVRMNVCSTLAKIMICRQVSLTYIKRELLSSLGSRNWFERQSVFRILENICKQQTNPEKELIGELCQLGIRDTVMNVASMAVDILQKFQ